MDPEKPTPITLDEWRKETAILARRVASNIDGVMTGKGFDPKYTLPVLKIQLDQLDSLGLRPDNEEFNEKVNVLNDQKTGGVNTSTIREVADYLSPPEPKSK